MYNTHSSLLFLSLSHPPSLFSLCLSLPTPFFSLSFPPNFPPPPHLSPSPPLHFIYNVHSYILYMYKRHTELGSSISSLYEVISAPLFCGGVH